MLGRWRAGVAGGVVALSLTAAVLGGGAVLADGQAQCSTPSGPSQAEIDQTVSQIQEPTAREAYLRSINHGPGEVVPGFGGLFLDPNDNSIVYVHLLDPSDQEAARQAAEKVLGSERMATVREVRPLKGQYSWSQLTAWYDCYWQQGQSVSNVTMGDVDEAKNRLTFGVIDEGQVALVEQELAALGIPREAVNIEVTGPIMPLAGAGEEGPLMVSNQKSGELSGSRSGVSAGQWGAIVGGSAAGLALAGLLGALGWRRWARRQVAA